MATPWKSAALIDGGLTYGVNNITSIRLLKAWNTADNFATVQTNTIGSATCTSGDMSITAAGLARVLNLPAGKTGTFGETIALGSADLAVAYCSATAHHLVLNITDMAVTQNNPFTFPTLTLTENQPV